MDSPNDTPLRCIHYMPEIRLETGGVARMVIDTVQHLGDAGVEVTLVTHDSTDCPGSWSQPGGNISVVVIPPAKSAPLYVGPALKKQIRQLLDQHDVLHLHTPWTLLNPAFATAARQTRTPYLITLHGMLDDWSMTQSAAKKRWYLKLFGRKLLEGAASVHCTAESERDQAQQWCPQAKMLVLPIIVDLGPYDPQPTPDEALQEFPHLQQAGLQLLFLSRVHVKKGLERLLGACSALKQRGIAFQVAIAGPGEPDYVEQLKAMTRELAIDGQTHWLGMVGGSLKRSLYAASDAFVLPTSQENFGLVYPEALLCGTPVIATKGTDIWRELEEAGATISDLDASSVADAIYPLQAMSHAERTELGQRGRAYVKRWLDPGQITQQYVMSYRLAIGALLG